MNGSPVRPDSNGPRALPERAPLRYPPCGHVREWLERDATGSYDLVSFFPSEAPEAPEALADLMQSLVEQAWQPTGNHHSNPEAPFAPDWASLWGILTRGLPPAPQISSGRAI